MTALPAFCLWKPSTEALPAVLLLLNIWKGALKVTAALVVMGAVAAKVVAALTIRVLVPPVPRTVLPRELKVLLLLTETAALAVTAAAKVLTALTAKVLLPPTLPKTVLPKASKALLAVTAALAVKAALTVTVEAKELVA